MTDIFWENFEINLNKYPFTEKFYRNILISFKIQNL